MTTGRLRIVEIRLSGAPDDVDQVTQRITAQFAATPPSRPYPSTVRVYLKVDPE